MVGFYQYSISNILRDPATQDRRIRDKKIVTNKLDAIAKGFGQQLPAVPVIFGESVFGIVVLFSPIYLITDSTTTAFNTALVGSFVLVGLTAAMAGR